MNLNVRRDVDRICTWSTKLDQYPPLSLANSSRAGAESSADNGVVRALEVEGLPRDRERTLC